MALGDRRRAIVTKCGKPVAAIVRVEDLDQLDPDDDEGEEGERSAGTGDNDVARTVFAASAPGRAAASQADTGPGDRLAAAYEHCHTARILTPPAYDQVQEPEEMEPGVRVTFSKNPFTLDQQAVTVEFSTDRYTVDQAIAWLAARNIVDYKFQPSDETQTPTTHADPEAQEERQPPEYSDMSSFLSSTIETEEPGEGSGQPSRVRSYATLPDWVTRAARKMDRANANPDAEKRYTCPTCNNKFDDDEDEPATDETRRCHRCGNLLDDAARMEEWRAEAADHFEKAADDWYEQERAREQERSKASHAAHADAQADAEAAHSAGGVDQYLADLDGDAIRHAGEQLGEQFALADALDGACEFLSNKQLLW
jgi:DNA-directed RNA polymerase subunit RPC12/RpoP